MPTKLFIPKVKMDIYGRFEVTDSQNLQNNNIEPCDILEYTIGHCYYIPAQYAHKSSKDGSACFFAVEMLDCDRFLPYAIKVVNIADIDRLYLCEVTEEKLPKLKYIPNEKGEMEIVPSIKWQRCTPGTRGIRRVDNYLKMGYGMLYWADYRTNVYCPIFEDNNPNTPPFIDQERNLIWQEKEVIIWRTEPANKRTKYDSFENIMRWYVDCPDNKIAELII